MLPARSAIADCCRTFGRQSLLGRRALALIALLSLAQSAYGQGIYLPSVGPVNQSFGGAAVASPIDASSALNWNSASISGLESSEVAFGFGLVLPTTSVSSAVGANAFGAGAPPIDLSGSTDSEPGVCCVPTIGFTHRGVDSRWTLGLGIFGVGGFSANYPSSTTNPILTPQPPNGLGLGRVYAKGEFYQVVPTVSYAITDRLAFGIAPTLTLANVTTDALFLAPPNNANGDTFFTYGPGSGTRTAIGGGFQLGLYYITDCQWHFGASYKSQQWFEPFRVRSQDELGGPLFATFDLDLPSITSLGFAYSGWDRWLFATDFRYFDYSNVDGFGTSGFNPNGSVAGLGWRSVMSVSQGVSFDLTPRLTLRTGYSFNQNPIPDSQTMFNVHSSLIIQHWYSVGGSFRWNEHVSTSIAYTHGFANDATGPFVLPAGPVPNTSVSTRVSADILNAGITVHY